MLKDLLRLKGVICIALIILMPTAVSARGVSAYLPLNMSPEIERQIEQVLILAGKPVMTRPIAVATVQDALPDARKVDEALCEKVELYLERYTNEAALTHLRAEVAVNAGGDSDPVLPNQHGMKYDTSWQVSAEAYYKPSDYILINLGGIGYNERVTPTGSMLSLGIDYAQLDIGYRDHWLSPFTDSSMLISTEAPTMPSITISNYKPISFLGLSYEFYFAEMSKSSRIAYQDRFTTGNPRLGGVHLQIEPVKGFSFSANRQLQFGGGERSESFSDFIHALRDPGKYDNAGEFNSYREFGNQQASFTSRMLFPGKLPFAVYFEYAGEDTSFRQRYRIGKVSCSMGIDFPCLWKYFDLTYETTEWQNAWYAHSVYQDGMTNEGSVIGHWFGDQRQFNDAAGGMSHMLRLGWQVENGDYLQATYRTLINNKYTTFEYERMHELEINYSHIWHGQTIGLGLSSGRDVYGEWYARLSASMDFAQEWLQEPSKVVSKLADTNDTTDFFLDMGAIYSYSITSYVGDVKTEKTPTLPSHHETGAHLGFGARHSVSDNNDLGVRIEWDRVAGYDLFSARLLDYRYRIGNKFALNGFCGVSRYNLGSQPYSYYLGAGSQLINIMPRWDLSIDWRKSMNMEQDYTIRAVTVYLSRRF